MIFLRLFQSFSLKFFVVICNREISEAQRALHPDFVESVDLFPDRTIHGVVLANELLDNWPSSCLCLTVRGKNLLRCCELSKVFLRFFLNLHL